MTLHSTDEPGIKLSIRKVVSGAVSAAATWAFLQYVPGAEDLPAEISAAIPPVVATVVFYFVPEKVEVPYGESQQ
jgi:hypothetical protein